MTRSFAALLFVVACSQFTSASDAQIFKCEVKGKVNYSDRPCATGSQRVLNASPNSAGAPSANEETQRRQRPEAKVQDSASTSGSSTPGPTVGSKGTPTAAECHARSFSAGTRIGDELPQPVELDLDLTQCTRITREGSAPRRAASKSARAVQIAPPVEHPAFPGEPTSDRARPIRAAPIPFGAEISTAPLPRDFTVVGVQQETRTVTLRSQKGVVADVYVGERVYDITRLKPGTRLKVDFALPNDADTRIRAASMWAIEAGAPPQ